MKFKNTSIGTIPENWQVLSLKECTDKITDGTHSTVKDNPEGEFYLLSCKNIKNGQIVLGEKERKIDYQTLTKLRARTGLCKDDILLTTVGTIGESAIIKNENINYEFQRSVAIIRADKQVLYPNFLYYLTKYNKFKSQAEGLVRGSVQKCLFLGAISDIIIPIPPLDEQEKIVNILSSLDDKIELNNEMNKTLEEMAQSIFKRWFVDFEFPNEDGEPYKSSGGEMVDSELGMIPKGWEVKTLDDIGDIVSGGTPSTKNEEYYGGDISWITPKDLSGYDRKFISKGERSITELGLQKSSAKLLPKGTVLFSSRAPIGYVAIAEKEVSTNQGFKSVVCNEEIMNNNYVYYFLKYNKENIENVSSGSTFKEISGTHMKNIKIIVPSKVILDKFNDLIKSFDSLLKKNYEDIDTLEEIRDSLLPKLMSGEIKVN